VADAAARRGRAAAAMRTAFVVLTYNRSDALLTVLRALAPQCSSSDVVVIADDGSRAEHVAALRAGLPDFRCAARHVWHPDTGFTAAAMRNVGAFHAEADYIVFLDGDCIPGARFAEMHKRLAAPGFFVNGSRVLLSTRLTARVLAGETDLASLQLADWLRLQLGGDINKLSHLVHWPGAPLRRARRFRWTGIRSCNLGLWYGDLKAVNGFDQSFSGWGHEDADFVLRLHNHGSLRKNGFFGTEVFHLAHPEHSRGQEAANRERVLQRMRGCVVRAEAGLAQSADAPDVILTELN